MDAALRIEELIERHVMRALMRLPASWQVRLSRKPEVRVDGDVLHPELQLMLSLLKVKGVTGLCDLPPKQARLRMRRDCLVHVHEDIQVGSVRDFTVPGPAGAISVRHYAPEPRDGGPRPLVVFIHGGGFVLGDLETHDAPCRMLCRRAGVHVLAVDYRLAPEFPFPAALEDSRAAFEWAAAHASELGADPARVAIGGDSAGGNLAAVVAQLAVRDGGAKPAIQLLLYPAVDRGDRHASRACFAEGFLLTRRDIDAFRGHYVYGEGPSARTQAEIDSHDPDDPCLSPLLARDFAGLPRAVVVTAAFDPLRDEGEAYARALETAGVTCVARRQPGMIHGFINLTGASPACRRAYEEVIDLFARELEA